MKWAKTRLSLVPVTGGRAGLEAEGAMTAEEAEEATTTEEAEDTLRDELVDERVRLTLVADAEAGSAVVEEPREAEVSMMLPVSELGEEADEAIKPETGSTALGSIDEVVGMADTALVTPDDQLCPLYHNAKTYR